MGTSENSPMHVSSAVPVALRSREYYLNHFRNADRVTTHGYLLLDGDTAIDTSEGRYKTGNFTGVVTAILYANVIWFALCPCL